MSKLPLPSDQAARKARRKERRRAAAKAEIEEGSKTKQESDELGEKVSQIHINKLVKEQLISSGILSRKRI